MTGLEAYFIDNDAFPAMHPMRDFVMDSRLAPKLDQDVFCIEPGNKKVAGITTPVGYLWDPPRDPYGPIQRLPYAYWSDGKRWILYSAGPNGEYDIKHPSAALLNDKGELAEVNLLYDPTNGFKSAGDVVRVRPPNNR